MKYIKSLAIGLALSITLLASARALANPPTYTPGKIVSGRLGKCLDIRGADTSNGTPVQLWDCVDVPNQTWTYQPNGEIRGYGTKCLDVAGPDTADGTAVQVWDCADVENQKWTFDDSGRLVGYGGKCLDAPANGNGKAVSMWGCEGSLSWRLGQAVSLHEVDRLVERCEAENKRHSQQQDLYMDPYNCSSIEDDAAEAGFDPQKFLALLSIHQFQYYETQKQAIEGVAYFKGMARVMLIVDHLATLNCAIIGGTTASVVGGALCDTLWTALTSDLDTLEGAKIIACAKADVWSTNFCKWVTDEFTNRFKLPCNGECAAGQTCELVGSEHTCVTNASPTTPPLADPCSGQCGSNQTCQFADTGYTCITNDPCSGQCGPNQTCKFADTGYTCITQTLFGEGESCDAGRGSCINVNNTSCSGGTVKSGLCPGSSAVKCCSTAKLTGVDNACDFNGQYNQGRCINTDTTSCSGTVKSGLCPGPAAVRCCSDTSNLPL